MSRILFDVVAPICGAFAGAALRDWWAKARPATRAKRQRAASVNSKLLTPPRKRASSE